MSRKLLQFEFTQIYMDIIVKLQDIKNLRTYFTKFGQSLDDKHTSISLKGSRTGHYAKVSLWYASLLTTIEFRFLYFRISNC